jgi:hypothetical protein
MTPVALFRRHLSELAQESYYLLMQKVVIRPGPMLVLVSARSAVSGDSKLLCVARLML